MNPAHLDERHHPKGPKAAPSINKLSQVPDRKSFLSYAPAADASFCAVFRTAFFFTPGAGSPCKNDAQCNSRAGFSSLSAFLTAISATAFTTHSKFSRPTEFTSASGAGFMKSMAYGTPASTANSTVFQSYPRDLHKISESFSIRPFRAECGGGFPFTYRS